MEEGRGEDSVGNELRPIARGKTRIFHELAQEPSRDRNQGRKLRAHQSQNSPVAHDHLRAVGKTPEEATEGIDARVRDHGRDEAEEKTQLAGERENLRESPRRGEQVVAELVPEIQT